MTENFEEFRRKHDYVVCFDSDGTVLDAMSVKHNHCHGPAFIEVWGLTDHADEVQALWNRINLYESTRGINRFLALDLILRQLDGILLQERELPILEAWLRDSPAHTDAELEKAIARCPCEILKKARQFSKRVNERISALSPKDKPVFKGVFEAFRKVRREADLAVVSSSNRSAIMEEWGYYGLLDYVDMMTSLETGSKSECLRKLVGCGYDPANVLMVGDALQDRDAAAANGTGYYQIVPRHEEESWAAFPAFLDRFLHGDPAEEEEQEEAPVALSV
ncbi:MAG: HAD hydrolase-like protein [Lachnospiraceae bacterium]|nr:HAD hydrolase-like protein [Lachnospiraceae bacterium]MBP5253940.1 HAD hydrolase-like protein [Lachnospiraceae bacterium]